MTERKKTYISFYADRKKGPAETDTRYLELLKAWDEKGELEFELVPGIDKEKAAADPAAKEKMTASIKAGLDQAKNILLIIAETTRQDSFWIPVEIAYAVDECRIPVIAAYVGYKYIIDPSELSDLWPHALKDRIDNESARVIHIPFERDPLFAAMIQFDNNNYPQGSLSYYSRDAYADWNLMTEID